MHVKHVHAYLLKFSSDKVDSVVECMCIFKIVSVFLCTTVRISYIVKIEPRYGNQCGARTPIEVDAAFLSE